MNQTHYHKHTNTSMIIVFFLFFFILLLRLQFYWAKISRHHQLCNLLGSQQIDLFMYLKWKTEPTLSHICTKSHTLSRHTHKSHKRNCRETDSHMYHSHTQITTQLGYNTTQLAPNEREKINFHFLHDFSIIWITYQKLAIRAATERGRIEIYYTSNESMNSSLNEIPSVSLLRSLTKKKKKKCSYSNWMFDRNLMMTMLG